MPKSKQVSIEQRLVLAHLSLELFRTMHGAQFPGSRFGEDFDLLFVLVAVFIGDAEGRPMTASKVAAYLEKPRATVLRKLDALCKRGAIVSRRGRFFIVREEHTGTTLTTKLTRVVIAAAEKLSNLDTLNVTD